jgi:hypothetical protein
MAAYAGLNPANRPVNRSSSRSISKSTSTKRLVSVESHPVVSATRFIESLLTVLREVGLITIFWDGHFSGAQKLFDVEGEILAEATHIKRIDKFLGELIWMSKVLRYGRESVSI